MNPSRETLWKRLPVLFEIPAPDADRARQRIWLMERNLMLPVKLFFVAAIFYSFKNSPWMGTVSSELDVTVETVQLLFGFYILFSVLLAAPLFAGSRLPLALLQWTVVTTALVDGLVLAAMTLITGGVDSILFWLFVGLIVRNAVSVPPGFSQIFLNFATSLCYALAAAMDAIISRTLDDATIRALDLSPQDQLGEPFVLRMLVLWLMTLSCYGAQAFLERQRLAAEEADEFAARENQLHSAGRLAAEFAHQIKNPLAVINNTAHSLRRAVRTANAAAAEQQIEIIQEEVARADKVITQVMGYAQLSEGRVEKLDVIEKIDQAVELVFPAAVPAEIKVVKNIAAHFPPLLMQGGHFSEILVNLLRNARDAVGGRGNILVEAATLRNHAIEISVADDGPGIAPDKVGRIFEAYFTTKENGTGLGLAIVKHNAELYGGSIRVDSALGKGARFTVTFPAKALPKPFLK
jgi:signal transduction histidine kinase